MTRARLPDPALEHEQRRTIRVLIVDHHPATRAGVRLALEQHGFEICGEGSDAAGAVEAAVREQPDICLLEVDIPGNGLAALGEIVSRVPGTRVVVFTGSSSNADFFDALRRGAAGYLLKDIDPLRLPLALEAIFRGEAALPRRLVARLIDEFREREQRADWQLSRPRGPALTKREWDVLELLRDGLTTAEIAERLFVSPGTVRTHVASILRKLRVPDRRTAVELLAGR